MYMEFDLRPISKAMEHKERFVCPRLGSLPEIRLDTCVCVRQDRPLGSHRDEAVVTVTEPHGKVEASLRI